MTTVALSGNAFAEKGGQRSSKVAIAIHGGAGTILKSSMTTEKEAAYKEILSKAVKHGYTLLQQGEKGEVAVVETIKILESSPLFNAGIGAVYTFDGEHELDASIMHGGSKNAGAVAGVKTIRSPIEAALLVMNESPHVMLSGKGAEEYAKENGLEQVDNSIFDTEFRKEALDRVKARMEQASNGYGSQQGNERFGTVGAVVLDSDGNIVAGTSTGGMTAKRYGRIGDSPIIGAGTYADNESCAVSATGHGEYFIRYHVAADICARMKYQEITLEQAANTVVHDVLVEAGGDGGVIAIDGKGNIAMPFNSAGMYRASIDTEGNITVSIYKD
ncbi:isoaspartyl peptidase/L-asparaginase family protein [Alteromonas marina]|uniref:isoaspartyl peptidase/L-asparaginase family protein n=1 Tax=Alteromonas sp. KUL150 TaxID=2480805 RepID=UPI0012E527D3|nr:isoaspartyl peptidase/L-asparaginase [Alteromonas sp. KUL150]GFD71153.1 isoaspartyl peptidase/L-asparaginase [Tenacibaculum sp. KUL113]GFD84104.1 isoaspartyl peptidase/L-asparaginase [Alteromonas sp. KUL150]